MRLALIADPYWPTFLLLPGVSERDGRLSFELLIVAEVDDVAGADGPAADHGFRMRRQEILLRAAQPDVLVIGPQFHIVGPKVAREVSRNHLNPQYAGGRRIDPHVAGVPRHVPLGAESDLPAGILLGDLETVPFGIDAAGAGILEVLELGGRTETEEIDQGGSELARRQHAADILHGLPKRPAAHGDVAVVFLAA